MTVHPVRGPLLQLGSVCEPVLRALPDWFGIESAIVEYVQAIDALPTFCIEEDRAILGFMSVRHHFPASAELYVLAVRPEHHRRGFGQVLLRATEAHCRAQGVRFLQVKTLSPARESEAYAKTRRFYDAMGFVPFEEFPELWGPANPCLQMVKAL
ncbi:MAG: GNAT family N-acetyltransferase [Planctomycetes bacterium]|nr:GNAT family N-acetyltransferase [Planctomycetota bacterium]